MKNDLCVPLKMADAFNLSSALVTKLLPYLKVQRGKMLKFALARSHTDEKARGANSKCKLNNEASGYVNLKLKSDFIVGFASADEI